MKDFRDLEVWERSHRLTLAIYRFTSKFPQHELYGLSSQIRRSCASIPANIAEGCGTRSDSEFRRYLQIASGSASELDYHLLLARDLGYLPPEQYEDVYEQLNHIRRMLTSLLQKVSRAAAP